MKTPNDYEFDIAIAWLESNEGINSDTGQNIEQNACFMVAKWLRSYQLDQNIKKAARKAKIPVAVVRKKVKWDTL